MHTSYLPGMRTILLAMVMVAVAVPAHADESRAWVKTIPDDKVWATYSRTFCEVHACFRSTPRTKSACSSNRLTSMK